MNDMFPPLIGKIVIVCLDDVLICSREVDLHAKLLDQVLAILWDDKMYSNLFKC